MKCLEQGHVYRLDHLDGDNKQNLIFVNRNDGLAHQGTNNQEVLRALIDRVRYLDAQIPWKGNAEIIQCLQKALVLHESRHLERLVDRGLLAPEKVPVGDDGHFLLHVM